MHTLNFSVAASITLTDSGAIIDGSTNYGVQPSDTNPTDANDTFRTTAANLDTSLIDGVGGNDTLNVYSVKGDTTPSSVDNVNKILLASREGVHDDQDSNGENQIDASSINGAQEYWSNGSRVDALTVDNVANLATVGMQGNHDDAVIYTVNFDASVTDSNSALDVVLDGAGSRTADGDGAELIVAGFDTFNISNTGTSTLSDIGDNGTGDVTTLNITGDGDLTLNAMDATVTTVDATGGSSAYTGDLDVTFGDGGNADATAGVSFTGSEGEDAVDFGNVNIENANANDSLTASMGAVDDEVALGDAVSALDGTYAGSVSLDGGEGSNVLLLRADGTGGDFANFIDSQNVTLQNFQEVGIQVDDAALGPFDMANFAGTTDYGFAGGVGNNNNVTANAANLTSDFELSFGANTVYDAAGPQYNALGDVQVTNIRDAQDTMTVTTEGDYSESKIEITAAEGTADDDTISVDIGGNTVTATVDDTNKGTIATDLKNAIVAANLSNVENVNVTNTDTINITAATGESVALTNLTIIDEGGGNAVTLSNQESVTGNVTLDAAEKDGGISTLTLTSEADAQLSTTNLGELNTVQNTVGTIQSRDASTNQNQTLTTVNVVAASNIAANGVNVYVSEAAVADTISLNMEGDGAVDLGTLATTGTNINKLEISNTSGSGDRAVKIDGQADLDATGGNDQAAGEGVVIDGSGTGELTFKAAGADLNGLTINASAHDGTTTVETTGANSVISAAYYTNVDKFILAHDIGDNDEVDLASLEPDSTVRITSNQTGNNLTLQNRSAGDMDVELVDNTTINNNLDIQGVVNLNISATDTNSTDDGPTIVGIANEFAVGNTVNLQSITLTADDTETLALTDNIVVSHITEASNPGSFTLNVDGTGGVNLGANNLDLSTAANEGTTATISEVTIDVGSNVVPNAGNAIDLGTVNFASQDTAATTVDLNLTGGGAADVDSLNLGNTDTTTLNLTSEGGSAANVIDDVANDGNLTELSISGDQDLTFGDNYFSWSNQAELSAGGFGGDLTAYVDVSDDLTLNTGSGDDTLYIKGTSATDIDTDGGDDTVKIKNGNSANLVNGSITNADISIEDSDIDDNTYGELTLETTQADGKTIVGRGKLTLDNWSDLTSTEQETFISDNEDNFGDNLDWVGAGNITITTSAAGFDTTDGTYMENSYQAYSNVDNTITIADDGHTNGSTLNGVGGENTLYSDVDTLDITNLTTFSNIYTADLTDVATSLTMTATQHEVLTQVTNGSGKAIKLDEAVASVDLADGTYDLTLTNVNNTFDTNMAAGQELGTVTVPTGKVTESLTFTTDGTNVVDTLAFADDIGGAGAGTLATDGTGSLNVNTFNATADDNLTITAEAAGGTTFTGGTLDIVDEDLNLTANSAALSLNNITTTANAGSTITTGGDDEVTVADLSGTLTGALTITAEAAGGTTFTGGTLNIADYDLNLTANNAALELNDIALTAATNSTLTLAGDDAVQIGSLTGTVNGVLTIDSTANGGTVIDDLSSYNLATTTNNVTITGGQNLTLGSDVSTALTLGSGGSSNLNASALTGNLTAHVDKSGGANEILLGEGNDEVTLYDSDGDGTAVTFTLAATHGENTITGFTNSTDKMDFATQVGGNLTLKELDGAGNAGVNSTTIQDFNDSGVKDYGNGGADDSSADVLRFTDDTADSFSALMDGLDNTVSIEDGDTVLMAFEDTSGNTHIGAVEDSDTGNGQLTSADTYTELIELTGVTQDQLVAGDFVFA